MKLRNIFFSPFALILILSFCSLGDRDSRKQERVKQALLRVFDLCKVSDYSRLAGYFVYRGPEKRREWKDVYDASNEKEMRKVELLSAQICGYLEMHDSYEFVEFTMEKEPEGEWCVWKVAFNSEEKTTNVYFAFLKIKGNYAIGDIDLALFE